MLSRPSEGESRRRPWLAVPAIVTVVLFPTDPARAASCTVPGTHTTLAAAIQDPNCTMIQLAAITYSGDQTIARSLMLSGQAAGGTRIRGTVSVLADALLDLRELGIVSVGPDEALLVTDGASVTVSGVTVDCCQDPLFSDGFESGNVSAWAATSP
jgi:hypothetical protein